MTMDLQAPPASSHTGGGGANGAAVVAKLVVPRNEARALAARGPTKRETCGRGIIKGGGGVSMAGRGVETRTVCLPILAISDPCQLTGR